MRRSDEGGKKSKKSKGWKRLKKSKGSEMWEGLKKKGISPVAEVGGNFKNCIRLWGQESKIYPGKGVFEGILTGNGSGRSVINAGSEMLY